MLLFKSRRRRDAKELLDRGLRLLETEPREASYLLAQSVALDPTQAGYLHLGAALETLGDLALAEAAYTNAKRAGVSRPNHNTGVARLQLAHLRLKAGDFEWAETYSSSALEALTDERPDAKAYAYLTRGLARWRQGRETDAQADFEWVLSNSQNPELQRTARTFLFSTGVSDAARGGWDRLWNHLDFLQEQVPR